MNSRSYSLAALAVIAACFALSCSRPSEEADINAALQRLVAAVNAKDINGIMAYYSPDETLLVFDALPPRQYVGAAAFRKDWEGFLAAYPTSIHPEATDWKAETDGNLRYAHRIFPTHAPHKIGSP